MKKKTYKQMQNRLYREIKRRLLLEHNLAVPLEVRTDGRQIDTLKVSNRIPKRMIYDFGFAEDHAKNEMARQLVNKLVEDEYITFYTYEDATTHLFDYVEIQARVDVVKPNILISHAR